MERDLEKDLIEIECAIKSQLEKDNMFTVSVLQRCQKLVTELKEYRELNEQGKLLKLPCAVGIRLQENAEYFQGEADGLSQVGNWGTAADLEGRAKAYRDAVDIIKSSGIE